jgi:hypothetical protein
MMKLQGDKVVDLWFLSRSMVSPEEAIKNSKLKFLTARDAKEVLAFYTDEANPIDVIKK